MGCCHFVAVMSCAAMNSHSEASLWTFLWLQTPSLSGDFQPGRLTSTLDLAPFALGFSPCMSHSCLLSAMYRSKCLALPSSSTRLPSTYPLVLISVNGLIRHSGPLQGTFWEPSSETAAAGLCQGCFCRTPAQGVALGPGKVSRVSCSCHPHTA